MGGSASPPAQFARSLADYVAVFSNRGGVEAFPSLGLKLKAGDDEKPVVSIVFPDTLASTVDFASGDRILDINGVEPENLGEFRFLLAGIEWGQRLGIHVMRGEETIEISALLFPEVESIDRSVAPGYVVEALDVFDFESTAQAAQAVIPDDRPQWSLVTNDGVPVRVEVRVDDVLEEVHELDDEGRVSRSLYRVGRVGGAVEVRYERDASGSVVATTGFDRAGTKLD
jgi:hypothetical protein